MSNNVPYQTPFPSEALGKYKKTRKEQEILFSFIPKYELEETLLVLTHSDL